MKYALFPGCVLEGAAKEAYIALKKIAEKLSIDLIEIENWTCCGASHAQGVDELALLAINARNIAIAEKMGLPVMTVCNTCTLQLRQTKLKLDQDEKLKAKVNGILSKSGYEYQGTSEITHLLWVLDAHPEILKNKITKALNGLKVAGYYGCHLVRPPTVMNYENGKNPQSLERLISALGAEPVAFDYRLKCCGFHAFFTAERDVLTVTGKVVNSAAEAGANIMVTPCPLCQMQIDMYQPEGRSATKSTHEIPVLHLPQLIGMALGISKDELGFSRHISGVDKI